MSAGLVVMVSLGPAVHGPAVPSPAQPVGYSAHVESQPDPGPYTKLIEDGGANSLRDDVSWAFVEPVRGQFDWSAPDEIVTEAARHHLNPLLIVDTSPAWASGGSTSQSGWFWLPPRSPAAYAAFAAGVAARYGNGGTFWQQHKGLTPYLPAGLELWNEENTAHFWGGKPPSPARYAAMVKAAYPAIKAVDPGLTVLTGGMAPAGGYGDVACTGAHGAGHDANAWNGVNYLQALYADGIGGSFDAVAWHPYNFWAGATAAQMLAGNRCSAWSQMASTHVSIRSLMTAHGDAAKTVWITEAGAPTCLPGATYTCVAPRQQAALATREVAFWHAQTWAGGFYWYDARDDNDGPQDIESHFGAVRADNTPKPAYQALDQGWTG